MMLVCCVSRWRRLLSAVCTPLPPATDITITNAWLDPRSTCATHVPLDGAWPEHNVIKLQHHMYSPHGEKSVSVSGVSALTDVMTPDTLCTVPPDATWPEHNDVTSKLRDFQSVFAPGWVCEQDDYLTSWRHKFVVFVLTSEITVHPAFTPEHHGGDLFHCITLYWRL